MSAISPLPVCPDVVKPSSESVVSPLLSRLADYVEIAKPRISLMVLLTVSCGFVLGMETATVSITLLSWPSVLPPSISGLNGRRMDE